MTGSDDFPPHVTRPLTGGAARIAQPPGHRHDSVTRQHAATSVLSLLESAQRVDALPRRHWLRGRAERHRSGRRRWLWVAAASAVCMSACADRDGSNVRRPNDASGVQSTVQATGWSPLPTSPLSPRALVTMVWTGSEVIVVGGTSSDCQALQTGCEPSPALADGAAYNPATRRWRTIAHAPAGVGGEGIVIGDSVFVQGGSARGLTLLEYEIARNEWREHPGPPTEPGRLVRYADTVAYIAYEDAQAASTDFHFDRNARRWRPLPADPLGPSMTRVAVWTPHGLVLLVQSERSPFVEAAIFADGAWKEPSPTQQLAGWPSWTWTGERLVNPHPGSASSVNGHEGRAIPHGGTISLPDGAWRPLNDPPPRTEAYPRLWKLEALGGRWSAIDGQVYDDLQKSWTALPYPDDRERDTNQGASPTRAVWAKDELIVFGGLVVMPDGLARVTADGWVFRALGARTG